jgi:hypothetical protein
MLVSPTGILANWCAYLRFFGRHKTSNVLLPIAVLEEQSATEALVVSLSVDGTVIMRMNQTLRIGATTQFGIGGSTYLDMV